MLEQEQRCSLHHSLQKQRVRTEKHDEEDRHYNVFLNASYINKLCTESEVPRGNCWHFRTIDRVLLLLYTYLWLNSFHSLLLPLTCRVNCVVVSLSGYYILDCNQSIVCMYVVGHRTQRKVVVYTFGGGFANRYSLCKCPVCSYLHAVYLSLHACFKV